MSLIIAAKTHTQASGQAIADALGAQGVPRSQMQLFYLNPPGQHDLTPIGGDMQADPGADGAAGTQAAGAAAGAAVGAAVGAVVSAAIPVIAPAAIAGLTGVGAHVGGWWVRSTARATRTTRGSRPTVRDPANRRATCAVAA